MPITALDWAGGGADNDTPSTATRYSISRGVGSFFLLLALVELRSPNLEFLQYQLLPLFEIRYR